MSKTFVGIVTYGNLPFTKLTIQSVKETVENPFIVCVVGKPNDVETMEYLSNENIPHILHFQNNGFPSSLNDLYDFGFKQNDFDYYIAMGNDVIAYPNAINSLIKVADETEYEWICAREVNVKVLCEAFPEVRMYFSGGDYIFTDFNSRPWDLFPNYNKPLEIDKAGMSDVHNLSLFKRSVFEKIGYIDVNFYPAYYEDNDYCRRGVISDIKSCTLNNAYYFHFWSRTFKQGSGGSTNKYFNMNKDFYMRKWGGDFGKEKYKTPFNGNIYTQGGIELYPEINIQSREKEKEMIDYWRNKHN